MKAFLQWAVLLLRWVHFESSAMPPALEPLGQS